MAELRQWIPDETDEKLVAIARAVSKEIGFRYPKKSLVNFLLKRGLPNGAVGNFSETDVKSIVEDIRKSLGDLSSFGRQKIKPSAGQKKRDSEYVLA